MSNFVIDVGSADPNVDRLGQCEYAPRPVIVDKSFEQGDRLGFACRSGTFGVERIK